MIIWKILKYIGKICRIIVMKLQNARIDVYKRQELGVSEIVPVKTKRCVVKLDDAKAGKKIKRWQGIAESAAKQSGRGIVPEISEVLDLEHALEYAGELQMKLIPYELCEDMKISGQEITTAAIRVVSARGNLRLT